MNNKSEKTEHHPVQKKVFEAPKKLLTFKNQLT